MGHPADALQVSGPFDSRIVKVVGYLFQGCPGGRDGWLTDWSRRIRSAKVWMILLDINQLNCVSKNEIHCTCLNVLNMYSIAYRVTHLVANLGWVDFDLGCSTILLGQ